ncbi:MAG: M56 family metallopeptidase [Flavobacteriaceae bacterium]
MEVIYYLIKSGGVLTLFYMVYKFGLSQETYFDAKRWYLLTGLLVSLLLPFVVIHQYVELVEFHMGYEMNSTSSKLLSKPTLDWEFLLLRTYGIGVILMSLRLLYMMLVLGNQIVSGKRRIQPDFTLVEVDEKTLPFSFFHWIVYNPKMHSKEGLEMILEHEKIHVLQRHSIDILTVQIYLIFQWFNPFVWLYQREMALNLEHLTDRKTLTQIENKKKYQYLLLEMAVGKPIHSKLVNSFYNSLIKNRIFMLNLKHSSPFRIWKLFSIIPLSILFVVLFNTQTLAQVKKEKTQRRVNIQKIALQIDKNTTQEELEKERSFMEEEGITLEFKKVQRNHENEITAIKAQFEAPNGQRGNYQISGNKPIDPFQFVISFKNNEIENIGFYGMHKSMPIPPMAPSPPGKQIKEIRIKSIYSGNGKTLNMEDLEEYTKGIVMSKKGQMILRKELDKDSTNQMIIEVDSLSLMEPLTIDIKDFKGGKGTNVFIMKSDSLKGGFISKEDEFQFITEIGDEENNFTWSSADSSDEKHIEIRVIEEEKDSEQPLVFVDGKRVNSLKEIDKNAIESIHVLKGKAAVKKYGENAEYGVIEIQTKEE